MYEKPALICEEFVPNEYVAACWGVACDTKAANAYEQQIGTYSTDHLNHGSEHCGYSGNQVIITNNNNTPIRMTEIGTDGLGTLNCTIYMDGNYRTIKPISSVNIGETIYWTTSAGNKTWHHQGIVQATQNNKPNMS